MEAYKQVNSSNPYTLATLITTLYDHINTKGGETGIDRPAIEFEEDGAKIQSYGFPYQVPHIIKHSIVK